MGPSRPLPVSNVAADVKNLSRLRPGLTPVTQELGETFRLRRILFARGARGDDDCKFIARFLQERSTIWREPYWAALSPADRATLCRGARIMTTNEPAKMPSNSPPQSPLGGGGGSSSNAQNGAVGGAGSSSSSVASGDTSEGSVVTGSGGSNGGSSGGGSGGSGIDQRNQRIDFVLSQASVDGALYVMLKGIAQVRCLDATQTAVGFDVLESFGFLPLPPELRARADAAVEAIGSNPRSKIYRGEKDFEARRGALAAAGKGRVTIGPASQCLVLTAEHLEGELKRQAATERRNSVLHELGLEWLAAADAARRAARREPLLHERRFAAGAVIVGAAAPPDAIFIVLEGECAIVRGGEGLHATCLGFADSGKSSGGGSGNGADGNSGGDRRGGSSGSGGSRKHTAQIATTTTPKVALDRRTTAGGATVSTAAVTTPAACPGSVAAGTGAAPFSAGDKRTSNRVGSGAFTAPAAGSLGSSALGSNSAVAATAAA
ncbi:unnamed protein product, partial [Phaeothamnion confervicola]